ncbi:secretion protein [Niastella caeni]|uniref:Secretion protein n=1 Tax=Niastella caeni TaxID=2569763 RepID=A0A4S8H6I5_9BACT|nr:secretion protein [Niastella caeni]
MSAKADAQTYAWKNVKYCRPRFIVAFWLILFCFSQTNLIAQSFGNVAFGGGGFITGIISHKTSGDVYCRTDVGGAYRWDAVNSKWIPLLDWNSEDETTYQGVEALALDPQNPNNLYLFAGTDYFNGGKTAILKSTDKGNTFSIVEVTSQFKTHGNALGRGNGERLAVDPNNSNVLFCGTKSNGLWKSTNGGSTWTLAWNGVTTTTNGNGICFVVFDPSSVSGGVTQTIYIGVSRTGANNIYKSTDGGNTFSAIQPDNSFMPHRAVLSSDNSTLYVSMADEQGPSNGSSGRVYKLATATGTWTNITPEGNNYPYGGVSVDPANKNRVIVSTVNVWNNNQFCNNVWGDRIYLSTDGGSTWTSKLTCTSTLNTNGIGWIAPYGIHWADCIDFDPLNTARVRVMSGNGLFTCDDINATNVSWKFDVKGLEETVVLDAISIPGGPLITVMGDQHGAVYASDIYTYATQLINPSAPNNTSVAYAANNTSKVVRVTDNLYYSTDQGSTWTQAASTNGGGYGKVALSADGNTILHCPGGSSTTYYSTNNGGSWTSTGVTNVQDAHPIADYVNTNKFYMYSPNSGQLLVSTNKGVSFTASASNPGQWGSARARAVPDNEGHVWVALGGGGLKYTTNNGTSWTTVANVTNCRAVGFGKAATGAAYPAVYIWGTVGGVRGMFRSTDQGASWTRINDDAHEWGGVGNGNFVMGDMNVYGRAYMATVGRGLVSVESDLSVLPLQFTHASVSQRPVSQKVYADVKWQTNADAGITGYAVERSLDAVHWQEVYTTTANRQNNYTYSEDVTALSGTIRYRIREINKSGYGSYSAVLTLRLSAITRTTISVRPNPVINNVINLYLNSQAKQQVVVRVVNLFGQTLYTSAVVPVEPGENVINIPADQFPHSNICFAEVLNAAGGSKIATIKIIF